MNNKNDLRLKISKLEAYSRQLCLNLRDLQKNREDITSKTLAISEELQCTQSDKEEDEDISSETDIHVLLQAKKTRGCCTVCKDCEGWEKDLLRDESEEMEDIQEPLKDSAIEEMLDTSECRCWVCCDNRTSYESFCEQCCCESTFCSDSLTNVLVSMEKVQDSEFCRVCNNAEEPPECYKFCGYQQNDNGEERCRGGVDCIETAKPCIIDVSSPTLEIFTERRISQSCESCAIRNLQGSLPVSSDSITRLKLFKQLDKNDAIDEPNIEELPTPFRDEDPLKLKQDTTILASIRTRGIWSKNNAPLDFRTEDESRVKINEFDRSNLSSQYLAAMDELPGVAKNDNVNVDEVKTSKRDLLMGLLVLFLIVFSRASRYPTLSSLTYYFNQILTHLVRISDRISVQFSNLLDQSAVLMKCLNQQFTRPSMDFEGFGNLISSHWPIVAALFASISLAKSLSSVAKQLLLLRLQKDFYDFYAHSSWLTDFDESIERFLKQIVFFTKSQYQCFVYLSCLAFGFFAGKASRVIDKWSLTSSSICENNFDL